jgi:hypothetical protein
MSFDLQVPSKAKPCLIPSPEGLRMNSPASSSAGRGKNLIPLSHEDRNDLLLLFGLRI